MFENLIAFCVFALVVAGCLFAFRLFTCERAPEPTKQHMHLNPPMRPMTRAQKQGVKE